MQLRGAAAARRTDESREHAATLAAGAGSVGHLARSPRGLAAVADLGGRAGDPAGEGNRCGGAGTPPRWHPLRTLARWHDVRPGTRGRPPPARDRGRVRQPRHGPTVTQTSLSVTGAMSAHFA